MIVAYMAAALGILILLVGFDALRRARLLRQARRDRDSLSDALDRAVSTCASEHGAITLDSLFQAYADTQMRTARVPSEIWIHPASINRIVRSADFPIYPSSLSADPLSALSDVIGTRVHYDPKLPQDMILAYCVDIQGVQPGFTLDGFRWRSESWQESPTAPADPPNEHVEVPFDPQIHKPDHYDALRWAEGMGRAPSPRGFSTFLDPSGA